MACKPICKLCNHLVISTAVTFTGGNLVITLPAGAYQNREKYCIVVAQTIPATTTINAPVFIRIGTGTVLYELDNPNCIQVLASALRTRTRYSTCVITNATGGTFRLLGYPCCTQNNALTSIDGTTPVTTEVAENLVVNQIQPVVATKTATATAKTTATKKEVKNG